jgi:hypothetical protein
LPVGVVNIRPNILQPHPKCPLKAFEAVCVLWGQQGHKVVYGVIQDGLKDILLLIDGIFGLMTKNILLI